TDAGCRRRGRFAQSDGNDSLQRDARGHHPRCHSGSRALRDRRAADRWREEGAGARRGGGSGWRTRGGGRTRRTRRRGLVTKRRVGMVMATLATLPCKVGPGYERPEVAVPESYRFTDTTVYSPDSLAKLDSAAATIADVPWWQVFGDDTLQTLINEGLQHN